MVINPLASECLHCSESSAESIPNKPNVQFSCDEPRQGHPSEWRINQRAGNGKEKTRVSLGSPLLLAQGFPAPAASPRSHSRLFHKQPSGSLNKAYWD